METFLAFLAEYGLELSGGAALIAIVETVFKPFRKLFGGTQTVKLDEESAKIIAPTPSKTTATLDVHEFIAIRREMKADLEQELSTAHEDEKTELHARIAELQSQIDAPDKALAEAQKTIADLKARLARMGNEVGGDRLAEADAALAKLDFTVADAIFAEVEERQKLEVQQAARAAFGRGEVAEAEVRWHDAAEHYARAARLEPDFQSLKKACEFARRAGDYSAAFRHGEDLLRKARSDENQERLATALNEHALTLHNQGHFSKAEALFREALAIETQSIGKTHPNDATRLNNLALVVEAQGRYAEAEGLYREALAIDEQTIGKTHPNYAIRLNNLAGVLQPQGRYAEAEGLYREALAIDEQSIGKTHPDYAIHLNNLAMVVQPQGRYAEAEGLYREALAIDEQSIGKTHPDYAIHLNNLALVVQVQGRYAEAEGLYREALAIGEATIGKTHPSYAIRLNNLALVVKAQGRYEDAEPLYRDAIKIALDRLGPDHPNSKGIQANLDDLLARKP